MDISLLLVIIFAVLILIGFVLLIGGIFYPKPSPPGAAADDVPWYGKLAEKIVDWALKLLGGIIDGQDPGKSLRALGAVSFVIGVAGLVLVLVFGSASSSGEPDDPSSPSTTPSASAS